MASPKIKPLQTESIARALPILTVVFGLGYALAAYAFLFIPKMGRVVPGGDLDLQPYQARLDETAAYTASLKAIQRDYAAVEPGRRARVQGMVPTATETQSLYVMFENLAAQSGGVLTGIDTVANSEVVDANGRFEVIGTANIQGLDYDQLKRLLAAVERAERIIDVGSISISGNGSDYSLPFRAYGFAERRLTEMPRPIGSAPAGPDL